MWNSRDLQLSRRFFTADEIFGGKPWFGLLMVGPQLIAYMIQVNYWLGQSTTYTIR
ncbi:MAG: hypothetical protein PHC56_00725 [Herbinix sp.]|nr:hypothetical protein [Herbinix sp.]